MYGHVLDRRWYVPVTDEERGISDVDITLNTKLVWIGWNSITDTNDDVHLSWKCGPTVERPNKIPPTDRYPTRIRRACHYVRISYLLNHLH